MKTQKMTRYTLAIVLSVSLIFSSCSKTPVKPVPVPEPSPVTGYLSKLEYSDGSYDSLFYNADGTIKKLINHSVVPAHYNEIFLFEYDSNKKLTRITDNNGENYDYKYFGGKLSAVTHYVNNVKRDYKIYDYQNDKLVAIEEYYQIAPNAPGYEYVSKRELNYYADGNLKNEVSYSFDPQTHAPIKDFTIEHIDYDTKFNPSDALGRLLYLSQVQMAKNNARKIIARSESSGATTVYDFEYTYNDFSNPLTRKMTYTSAGQTYTETVKYYYY
jgi:YD repeat-containing protein